MFVSLPPIHWFISSRKWKIMAFTILTLLSIKAIDRNMVRIEKAFWSRAPDFLNATKDTCNCTISPGSNTFGEHFSIYM